MFEVTGSMGTAKVFADHVESKAIGQIHNLLNQPFISGEKIRFMPDVHAGAGCVIGTTMTITDKVCPNLVGVDIGCGMLVARLGNVNIDLKRFDEVIREYIPAGFNKRDVPHTICENYPLDYRPLSDLKAPVDIENARLSLGTLGGGNHFIEIDVDKDGNKYIVIHSGSRHLGLEIAKYYQEKAYAELKERYGEHRKQLIETMKSSGREQDISKVLSKMPKSPDKELAYCVGDTLKDYLNDMSVAQDFASLSREAMLYDILTNMGLKIEHLFETRHNYIDLYDNILRKGAVSAGINELLIIPINMRDGSLICRGKGNADWNYSAPHGAGRIMSRGEAKANISMDEYKKSMDGIYTSCVSASTVDEAPFAYKPIDEIINNIGDTVEIIEQIKPIYNFKAN